MKYLQKAIRCQNLSVSYGKSLAIDNLSISFDPGSLWAIMGPNGGGKSTLLKTLMGFLRPDQGQIELGGVDSYDIAYLPQKSEIDHTFPLSVREVVSTGLCSQKGYWSRLGRQDQEIIDKALAETGLADCAGRGLDTLSGGQIQRVLFARLATENASVLLLDEPFTAIDPYTVSDLIDLIHAWSRQGKTILIVCHDLDLVLEHFPNTLLIAQRVIGQGRTQDVLTLENLQTAKKISRALEASSLSADTRGGYV